MRQSKTFEKPYLVLIEPLDERLRISEIGLNRHEFGNRLCE